MTYTFPISDLILMMLGTLSFGIGSAFGFAWAPAMEAVRTPNVGSAKSEDDDEEDDDDDDIPIVPNP